MAAICQSRMRFVSAEPVPNVEREKLANHVSASERSERRRARSGRAVRIPVRRSAFVGPCVSSRSATSAAEPPFGTTRCTRTTQPSRTNATSTVRGAGFGTVTRAGAATAPRDVAADSRSTASKPANASRRTTSKIRIGRSRFATRSEMPANAGADYRRGRADALSSRAESGDARATAPPPATQALGHAGRRARGGRPGAVAAVAIHRSVVSHRGVPRRRPHARGRAAARREGDAHEDDAPPRHARDYLAYAGHLSREPDPRDRASARSAWRGRRLRRRGRAPGGVRGRAAVVRDRSFSRCSGGPSCGSRSGARGSPGTGLTAYADLVNGPESSVWRSHTAGGTFVPARTWLGADGASGDAAAAQPRPPLPRCIRTGVACGYRAVDGLREKRRRPGVGAARADGDSATSTAASSTTCRARHCPAATPPRRRACCPASTTSS